MKLEFTAVFKKVAEGYVAFVEKLPGANTQGNTLEEARANLDEAVMLVLAANRALAYEPTPVPKSRNPAPWKASQPLDSGQSLAGMTGACTNNPKFGS